MIRPGLAYGYAMLCAETRDDIADRMRQILDGNYFTMVICNSHDPNSDRYTAVEVYPSQRLTSPIRDYRDDALPGISWGTTNLGMGVHTKAQTEADARRDIPHGFVMFTFEPYRFTIDHYAPAGYRLRWIFAVENHDEGAAS